MSKSIVIIETPKNCHTDCLMQNDHCCGLANRHVKDYYGTGKKPDWCPLRPLPKMRKTIGTVEENDQLCFNAGYNQCVSDILEQS